MGRLYADTFVKFTRAGLPLEIKRTGVYSLSTLNEYDAPRVVRSITPTTYCMPERIIHVVKVVGSL